MLDIAALQQFDFFSNFKLYAGKNGITRTVSNVVILDHEGFEDDFSDFYPGDFVITNLLYAKDNPDRIFSTFKSLISIGISAIAIKSIYFESLPIEVVELANTSKIPIFFFDNIYIEDVLLNMMDYIRSTSNYSYVENLFDSLINETSKEDSVKRVLDYFKKTGHYYVSSIYLTYNRVIDDVSILRNVNQILHNKSNLSYGENIICTKFKKGLFIIYFFEHSEKESFSNPHFIRKKLEEVLKDLHLSTIDFTIGYNDSVISFEKIDIAIKRAIFTNKNASENHYPKMLYSKMHLEHLLYTLNDSAYSKEYFFDLWTLIQQNSKQGNRLQETLAAFVKSNCHIDKTAELLFQHPNTIRYRLQKIKSILEIEDDFKFQMIAVLMVGVLYYKSES